MTVERRRFLIGTGIGLALGAINRAIEAVGEHGGATATGASR